MTQAKKMNIVTTVISTNNYKQLRDNDKKI